MGLYGRAEDYHVQWVLVVVLVLAGVAYLMSLMEIGAMEMYSGVIYISLLLAGSLV